MSGPQKKIGAHFARRTNWDMAENALAKAGKALKASGVAVTDLTVSNPTRCGFDYSALGIDTVFADPANLEYTPDPWGLPRARKAVSALYADMGPEAPVERILLTSSTSEGYNYVFRLLCDPGDSVLAPAPSYPLFQFLADVNDVRIDQYPLYYENGWHIYREALEASITAKTRAIIVVSPNNPTGSYLRADDMVYLRELALRRGLAIVCDEVFADYALEPLPDAQRSMVGQKGGPLTFVLSGLSKILAVPQMKLSWMIVQGEETLVREASPRLEMIADTFLSVNAPVQNACEKWFAIRKPLQEQIAARLRGNLETLRGIVATTNGLAVIPPEGGWYAVVRAAGIEDEDAFVVGLLESGHVMVHPGYYYDFSEGAHIVTSLLVEPRAWAEGLGRLAAYYTRVRKGV